MEDDLCVILWCLTSKSNTILKNSWILKRVSLAWELFHIQSFLYCYTCLILKFIMLKIAWKIIFRSLRNFFPDSLCYCLTSFLLQKIPFCTQNLKFCWSWKLCSSGHVRTGWFLACLKAWGEGLCLLLDCKLLLNWCRGLLLDWRLLNWCCGLGLDRLLKKKEKKSCNVYKTFLFCFWNISCASPQFVNKTLYNFRAILYSSLS